MKNSLAGLILLFVAAANGTFASEGADNSLAEATRSGPNNGGTSYWVSFQDRVRNADFSPALEPRAGLAFPDSQDGNGAEGASPTEAALVGENGADNPAPVSVPTERTVTVYDPDAATTTSATPLVFTIQNEEGDLSQGFSTDFVGLDQWFYMTFAPLGVASSSGGAAAGYLGLEGDAQAPAGAIGCFARWQTQSKFVTDLGTNEELIPWIPANLIYLARYRLTPETNSLGANHPSNKTYLPHIRLGVSNAAFAFVVEAMLGSANFPPAVGDVDGQLPDLGAPRNYDLLWSPMAGTPNWDNLNVPNALLPTFPATDMRTWLAFFDMVDFDSNGPFDEGRWRLESFFVCSISRPPDSGLHSTLSDLTGANGFQYEVLQPAPTYMNVQQNAPQPGMITLQDGGRGGTGSNFMAWRKMDVAPWLTGKVMRVSIQMSCPTTADRDNFHVTRIRHAIPLNTLIHVLHVREANLGPFLNPGMPAARAAAGYSGPTTYEAYVPSWGGPTPYLLSNLPSLSNWALSVDQVNNGAAANAQNATRVTIEQLKYEQIDEPSGP